MSGFIWDPAGSDTALSRAATAIKVGQSAGARELLAKTAWDYPLRAHRSLVLASAAADTDVAECWLREEPDADALLLYARVAVARALRGHAQDDRLAPMLIDIAESACGEAAAAAPQDPTPWAAWLALARLTPHQHSVWGEGPGEDPADIDLGGIRGPWVLLREVWARDPYHREAYQRFLACLFARYEGSRAMMWQFALWALGNTPPASDPHLLVLHAYAEDYRQRRADPTRSPGADGQWEESMARIRALELFCGGPRNENGERTGSWFELVHAQEFPPIADLSYLAHALYYGRQYAEATVVLAAMGPYAATMPWSLFGRPDVVLAGARNRCGLSPP